MSGVLATVPMRVERAALGRRLPGAVRVGSGPRRAGRAAAGLRSVLDRGDHSGLLIVGVCGALRRTMSPGDVVVASELRSASGGCRCAAPGDLVDRLRGAGLTVHIGPLYTADHLVRGAERATLAGTGALAVDTESAALAGAAGGRPVLAVRAVSDTPDHPLWSIGILRSGLSALRALRAAAPALAGWSPIEEEVG